ncbi:MAG TPA: permease, partial [Pyrodictiaceae archaeon]|nr:permease [Pyrodictiaceae archaeon]
MWKESVDYFTIEVLGLSGRTNDTINFFIYDTVKILFLLVAVIFIVSYLRTFFNTEYVRAYLQNRSEFVG